jgi:CheY-like chemotaxis protein
MNERVLIVEDDPEIRQMMASMLEIDGYEVATENDATHIVEMIEIWQPKVVVLDIMMPKIDGMQAMREINALRQPPRVLVVTGYMPDEVKWDSAQNIQSRENFQALGAWDMLTKPFEMEDFLRAIKEAARDGC